MAKVRELRKMLEAVDCVRWAAQGGGGAAGVFLLLPTAVPSQSHSVRKALSSSGYRVAKCNGYPVCLREGYLVLGCKTRFSANFCVLLAKRKLGTNADFSSTCNIALKTKVLL